MRDNLGVGLAGKFRAALLEALPQFAEILDDAVMDNGDILGGMRMGIALGRLAVRRPARVPDSGHAIERSLSQPRFKIFQLAFSAAAIKLIAFQRCDARGIIAAIFEAL